MKKSIRTYKMSPDHLLPTTNTTSWVSEMISAWILLCQLLSYGCILFFTQLTPPHTHTHKSTPPENRKCHNSTRSQSKWFSWQDVLVRIGHFCWNHKQRKKDLNGKKKKKRQMRKEDFSTKLSTSTNSNGLKQFLNAVYDIVAHHLTLEYSEWSGLKSKKLHRFSVQVWPGSELLHESQHRWKHS